MSHFLDSQPRRLDVRNPKAAKPSLTKKRKSGAGFYRERSRRTQPVVDRAVNRVETVIAATCPESDF